MGDKNKEEKCFCHTSLDHGNIAATSSPHILTSPQLKNNNDYLMFHFYKIFLILILVLFPATVDSSLYISNFCFRVQVQILCQYL